MSDVTLCCDGSSGAPELERAMAARLVAQFEIFKQRQRKYGSGNIARRGPHGIVVRLEDKIERLARALDVSRPDKALDFQDETLSDSCHDAGNYSQMIHLCVAGHWPGWPHP
jgi:hypothetical protein